MRHRVVWAACSVTNPANGDERILARGDMLPDFVDEFTRSVLASSGAVTVVEDAPETAAPETELPPVVEPPAGRPQKARQS